MKIIFGPINSRRFGKSLGIDLSPSKKQCNFDCLYCELEPAKTMGAYEEVVSVEEVMEALNAVLAKHQDIDALTVTANGEPTLYPYLSELMDKINRVKGRINTLILSNASTIHKLDTQKALMKFDTVKLSLDCATPRCLKRLDRANKGIEVESIKEGMLHFREKFSNPLIVEILMVKGINDTKEEIEALNSYLLKLKPTRIDIGTIDRPPAYPVEGLSYEEILERSTWFEATLPIYIAHRQKLLAKASSYSQEDILDTIKKRPLTPEDIEVLFDGESKERLQLLLNKKRIKLENYASYDFFVKNSIG